MLFCGESFTELEQREAGYHYYIWHSQDDEKVRHDHARYDDLIFRWDHPSPSGHPGEDYHCRCWPEPIDREDITGNHRFYYVEDHPIQGIDSVYPELILIPVARGAKIVGEGLKKISQTILRVFKNPISKRPKGVPKDWKKVPNKKGKGYTYKDPKSKDGGTYVKVSKGKSSSSNPGQQVDNVRVQKDGKSFDKYGNKVPQKSRESHIPLEEFEKYDPEKFK